MKRIESINELLIHELEPPHSLIVILRCLFLSGIYTMNRTSLYPSLHTTIRKLETEFSKIDIARKQKLQKLAALVREGSASFVFICTHNSRRSHIAQLWAQAAAAYFQVPGISTYSAGTVSTAFNPRAITALQAAKFQIQKETDGDNPVYTVSLSADRPEIKAFSKTLTDPSLPKEDFIAIMTCSHADANCPFVPGASYRLSLPYDDPKDFDGTLLEGEKYQERVAEIGREMLYAFSKVRDLDLA